MQIITATMARMTRATLANGSGNPLMMSPIKTFTAARIEIT
jgi:hypothetical protein